MYIKETWVNKTDNTLCGESEVYEAFTSDVGKLYKSLQKEYGRCIGKVYVGEGHPVGWIFLKKAIYEDTKDTYLQETWVELHDAPPTIRTEAHLHYIN